MKHVIIAVVILVIAYFVYKSYTREDFGTIQSTNQTNGTKVTTELPMTQVAGEATPVVQQSTSIWVSLLSSLFDPSIQSVSNVSSESSSEVMSESESEAPSVLTSVMPVPVPVAVPIVTVASVQPVPVSLPAPVVSVQSSPVVRPIAQPATQVTVAHNMQGQHRQVQPVHQATRQPANAVQHPSAHPSVHQPPTHQTTPQATQQPAHQSPSTHQPPVHSMNHPATHGVPTSTS